MLYRSRNPPYDPIDFRRDRSPGPGRRNDARDDGRYNSAPYPSHLDPPQRSNSMSRNGSHVHARDDYRNDLPRTDLFSNSNRAESIHRDIPRGPKSAPYARDLPRDPIREPVREFTGSRDNPPLGPRGSHGPSYPGDNFRTNDFRGNDFRGRGGIRGGFQGRGRGYPAYDDRDRLSDRDGGYREREPLVGRYSDRGERGRLYDDRPRGGYRGAPRGSSPPNFGRGRGIGRGYDDPLRRPRGARSRSPPPSSSDMYDQRAAARRSSMVSPPPTAVDVPAFGATADIPTGPKIPTPTRHIPRPPTHPAQRPRYPVAGTSTNSTPTEPQFPRPPVVPPPKPMITGRVWALRKKRSRPIKSLGDGVLFVEPLPNFASLREPLDLDDSETESDGEEEFSEEYFQEGIDRIEGQLAQLRSLRAENATLPYDPDQWNKDKQNGDEATDQVSESGNAKTPPLQPNSDSAATTANMNDTAPEKEIKETTDESGEAVKSLESAAVPPATVAPPLKTKESTKAVYRETAAAARPVREKQDKQQDKQVPVDEATEEPESDVPYVRPTLVLMELPVHVSKSPAEDEMELEAVRPTIKTPPPTTLKYLVESEAIETSIWDYEYKPPTAILDQVAALARGFRTTSIEAQADEAQEWKQVYRDWLKYHQSDDPHAKANHDRWQANKEDRMTPPPNSAVPATDSRTDRRTNSRFASEFEIARVMEESKRDQLAMEEKKKRNSEEAALVAITKEATIPDMLSVHEKQLCQYEDDSGLISPDRAVTVFEAAPADLSFTDEEQRIFLKAIVSHPKKWSIIAKLLPGRDYKDCIQFYYQVKHVYRFKTLLSEKKRGRKANRGTATKVKKGINIKPKANALTASMRELEEDNDNEGDDKPDDSEPAAKNKSGRPRRAATVADKAIARSESEANNPPPTKRRANKVPDLNTDGTPKVRKKRVTKDKNAVGSKQVVPADGVSTVPGQSRSTSASKIRVEDKDKRQKSYTPVPPPQPRQATESHLASRVLSGTMQAEPAMYQNWTNNEQSAIRPIIESHFSSQPVPMPMTHATNTPVMQSSVVSSNVRPEMSHPPYNDRMDGIHSGPVHSGPGLTAIEHSQSQRTNNPSNTTSYWSVPETNDFPRLLAHFGTDWGSIAKYMQSKSVIMVYTTVFQWLKLPDDSNKSRRITNIVNQVKNYYMRQVNDNGKSDWQIIAAEADARKLRGEDMGPPPRPASVNSNIRKVQPPLRNLGIVSDGVEDSLQPMQPVPMRVASPLVPQVNGSPALNARYPLLNQNNSSIPPLKREIHSPAMLNHPLSRDIQHDSQHAGSQALRPQPQQQQQQNLSETRPSMPPSAGSRGPTLGYFNQAVRHDRPVNQKFPGHGSITPGTPHTPLTPADLMYQESIRQKQVEAQAEAEAAQRLIHVAEEHKLFSREQRDRTEEQPVQLKLSGMEERARVVQAQADRDRIDRQRREEEETRRDIEQAAWRNQEAWRSQDRGHPYSTNAPQHHEGFANFELRQRQLQESYEAEQAARKASKQYEKQHLQAPNMMSHERQDLVGQLARAADNRQSIPRHDSQPYRVDGQPAFNAYHAGPARASSIAHPYVPQDRELLNRGPAESSQNLRDTTSVLSRNPISSIPARVEPPRASPAQSPAPSAPRQPGKTSNIMSLLNDEPSEPARAQSKPTTPLPQAVHSPLLQQSYPALSRTRNSSISESYQPHHQSQSSQSKFRMQQAPPSSHITSHPLGQTNQQGMHGNVYYNPQPSHHLPSSQAHGLPRSYTPQGHDNSAASAAHAPMQAHGQQQQQPRRDSSLNDVHAQQLHSQHARVASGSQSNLRLVESPYAPAPVSRVQQIASPLEHPRHMSDGRHMSDANFNTGRGYNVSVSQQQAQHNGYDNGFAQQQSHQAQQHQQQQQQPSRHDLSRQEPQQRHESQSGYNSGPPPRGNMEYRSQSQSMGPSYMDANRGHSEREREREREREYHQRRMGMEQRSGEIMDERVRWQMQRDHDEREMAEKERYGGGGGGGGRR